MSTVTEICQDALKEIGAYSIINPAPAESIIDAAKKLHSMLHMWESDDICIGFTNFDPLKPACELAEPIDTREAIVKNLAIFCAPMFDNGKTVVSEMLLMVAERQFRKVQDLYQKFDVPNKKASSTLPVGEGHTRNGLSRRIFFSNARKVGN